MENGSGRCRETGKVSTLSRSASIISFTRTWVYRIKLDDAEREWRLKIENAERDSNRKLDEIQREHLAKEKELQEAALKVSKARRTHSIPSVQ